MASISLVRLFLSTLLSGSAQYPEEPCSSKVQRLVNSFGQDLVFGVTGERQKPPKHLLLPYAVKTLTNNVDVIRFLNRCGHRIAYSQIEEMNTALCLQKMAMTPENTIPLPDNIKPYVSTSLAWDNIDRLEETLSGGGTSHRVNGIAIQARQYGPDLSPVQETPTITRSKQRSVEVVGDNELAIYNAGERCGPPRRSYVEVTSSEIEANAWKKNLLWILVRLHAAEKQTVCRWTGFNILVRSETDVSQDNIGYLPTIDAPATNMSTVFEVLRQSVQIKESLKLKSIVVVFDQALYAKAADITWKHSERFKSIVLRLGGFHTIVTFLGILGKRFQDAGLRDICIESGVVTEGSVAAVLEEWKYNRAVRFHKLMYEALMRKAWSGFKTWVTENRRTRKEQSKVRLKISTACSTNICEAEFGRKLGDPSFSELTQLFDQCMGFLRQENGKLSQFWASYLDMVEVLLGLLRVSREGNWELHLSCIRKMVPWYFAYDNINYARYAFTCLCI